MLYERQSGTKMATAYIALGSNLGDRSVNLDRGLKLLSERRAVQVVRVSSVFETTPVGGPPGQGLYLNAAAELQTTLQPRELLEVLLDVEHNLGRVRGERNAPRTLDLDLLLYDALVLQEADLSLPHPRLHERWFVLAPLAEIAPELVHPLLCRTIRELLQERGGAEREALSAQRSALYTPSPRELSGQRALVTGASSGIGRAIALELGAAGAEVLVHGRRADAAEEVLARITQQGARAHVILADLQSDEECARLVDTAWQTGPVQIWINNAGADTLTGEAAGWPFLRKLQSLLAIDVTATMLLSRAAGDRMKALGSGVILNMGWDQAETGMEGDSGQLFAAAKGAVMAFSKSLALTMAPEVRVNCLAPGWIRTAWGDKASSAWQERVRRETPLGRWGTPEDVARTARWLVSPAAAFITGQVVRINGGAVR